MARKLKSRRTISADQLFSSKKRVWPIIIIFSSLLLLFASSKRIPSQSTSHLMPHVMGNGEFDVSEIGGGLTGGTPSNSFKHPASPDEMSVRNVISDHQGRFTYRHDTRKANNYDDQNDQGDQKIPFSEARVRKRINRRSGAKPSVPSDQLNHSSNVQGLISIRSNPQHYNGVRKPRSAQSAMKGTRTQSFINRKSRAELGFIRRPRNAPSLNQRPRLAAHIYKRPNFGQSNYRRLVAAPTSNQRPGSTPSILKRPRSEPFINERHGLVTSTNARLGFAPSILKRPRSAPFINERPGLVTSTNARLGFAPYINERPIFVPSINQNHIATKVINHKSGEEGNIDQKPEAASFLNRNSTSAPLVEQKLKQVASIKQFLTPFSNRKSQISVKRDLVQTEPNLPDSKIVHLKETSKSVFSSPNPVHITENDEYSKVQPLTTDRNERRKSELATKEQKNIESWNLDALSTSTSTEKPIPVETEIYDIEITTENMNGNMDYLNYMSVFALK